jgi:hypothetical protein
MMFITWSAVSIYPRYTTNTREATTSVSIREDVIEPGARSLTLPRATFAMNMAPLADS